MLELNDPAWGKLTTAYGQGEPVAELLRLAAANPADGEARRELLELLLHQNTIYTATLAAMPYLAALAEQTEDDETLIDLYVACALMKASREGAEDEPIEQSGEFRRTRQEALDDKTIQSIALGYRDGIARLAALHDRATRRAASAGTEAEEDIDSIYLLAAYASYRGQTAAARLLFDFSTGDEYAGACPSCEADWYIWPREQDVGSGSGSLIVYTDDPILQGTDGQTPSDVRPAAPKALRPELQELAEEARRIGALRLARTIPSLDGHANCPQCGREESVWNVLTGWRG